MKPVLRLLAVVALAVPAFADSITFNGSHAGGVQVSGSAAAWLWEHSTTNPAWGAFDGGSAILGRGAVAFTVSGWTNASTKNIGNYTEGSPFRDRNADMLSGVHTQRLSLINGGNINGGFYNNGHGRPNSKVTVPEPETLGLLGTGLFFIGGLVRRKIKMRELLRSPHDL